MPSLKAIRRRIGTVKNTQKITKAMKLVAAARLRKAQQRIVDLRPYALKTQEVLGAVLQATPASELQGDPDDNRINPLMLVRDPVRAVALVVFTSDRGLAGAFNTNILRLAEKHIRELKEAGVEDVKVVTVGRKGREYFRRRGIEALHDFELPANADPAKVNEIARQLVADFVDQTVDRVEVTFTEFKSAMTQKATVEQLLPVKALATEAALEAAPRTEYIFEPNRKELLDQLLPMYVEVSLYRALLESLASEHGSRMTAMDNATRNAKEMISSLTLQYNRARQATITKELMEIIGGAEALKG